MFFRGQSSNCAGLRLSKNQGYPFFFSSLVPTSPQQQHQRLQQHMLNCRRVLCFFFLVFFFWTNNEAQAPVGVSKTVVIMCPMPTSTPQHHQQQVQSPSPLEMFNANTILGVSPNKRRTQRGGGGGGGALKAPARFSLLRFLATDAEQTSTTPGDKAGDGGREGAVVATGDAASKGESAEGGGLLLATAAGAAGVASFGRGDLVEFSVVARKGQRQQSQRTGRVTLVAKGGVPCR